MSGPSEGEIRCRVSCQNGCTTQNNLLKWCNCTPPPPGKTVAPSMLRSPPLSHTPTCPWGSKEGPREGPTGGAPFARCHVQLLRSTELLVLSWTSWSPLGRGGRFKIHLRLTVELLSSVLRVTEEASRALCGRLHRGTPVKTVSPPLNLRGILQREATGRHSWRVGKSLRTLILLHTQNCAALIEYCTGSSARGILGKYLKNAAFIAEQFCIGIATERNGLHKRKY